MTSITLIGNYRLHGQESMLRFANALAAGLTAESALDVRLWQPVEVFGRFAADATVGVGKWLGYIDTHLLSPVIFRLRRLFSPSDLYHVCDHSNAYYLAVLPKGRRSITCHDVIAIEAAQGDTDSTVVPSRFGRVLQRYVLRHLRRARRVACVSRHTLDRLVAVTGNTDLVASGDYRVIYNSFTTAFKPVQSPSGGLQAYGLAGGRPYLFHIGSGHTRKNRKMLIQMLDLVRDEYPDLVVCYAGKPLGDDILGLAAQLGLSDRVVYAGKPTNEQLEELFGACAAFVFPSFAEGFGMPIIEAQACGAPVLLSDRVPMPEVAGRGAILASPTDPVSFADALRALQRDGVRDELIRLGFENIGRFELDNIIKQYRDFILRVPSEAPRATAFPATEPLRHAS